MLAVAGVLFEQVPASRRRCLLASYGELDRETEAVKRTDEIARIMMSEIKS
jgi:hypothetical protein